MNFRVKRVSQWKEMKTFKRFYPNNFICVNSCAPCQCCVLEAILYARSLTSLRRSVWALFICFIYVLTAYASTSLWPVDLPTPNGLQFSFNKIFCKKQFNWGILLYDRYIICENAHESKSIVQDYLHAINDDLNKYFRDNNCDSDVPVIVPLEIMKKDTKFFNYIKESNEKWD